MNESRVSAIWGPYGHKAGHKSSNKIKISERRKSKIVWIEHFCGIRVEHFCGIRIDLTLPRSGHTLLYRNYRYHPIVSTFVVYIFTWHSGLKTINLKTNLNSNKFERKRLYFATTNQNVYDTLNRKLDFIFFFAFFYYRFVVFFVSTSWYFTVSSRKFPLVV